MFNAALAFAADLAMVALLAIGGFNILAQNTIGRWVLAVLLPAIAIAVWAYLIAPNNTHRLHQPWLCLIQLVLFTIAAVVAYRYINHTIVYIFLICAYSTSLAAIYLER